MTTRVQQFDGVCTYFGVIFRKKLKNSSSYAPRQCSPLPYQTKRRHSQSIVVLVRHGQSIWNKIPTFTGWCDVPLTAQGVAEAQAAGKLLDDRGYTFDIAYTSELQRAKRTCQMALQFLNPNIPLIETWQLNERHYGVLQGRAKNDPELFRQYGSEQIMAWRRDFDAAPPPMNSAHPYYQPPPAPLTESLKDCQNRVVKCWREIIVPSLSAGTKAIIVAHANTIRALVAFLDKVEPEDVPNIHIPNSVPCVFYIDSHTGQAFDTGNKREKSCSNGHWLLNTENQKRLLEKLGGNSAGFARSVFDSWDLNSDGVLSREELITGLSMWKRDEDKALSALAGKLWEELNHVGESGPITVDKFQTYALMGCRKHNLPFFMDEGFGRRESMPEIEADGEQGGNPKVFA